MDRRTPRPPADPRLARAMARFAVWRAAAGREADAARFAERVRRTVAAAGRSVRRIDRAPELVRPDAPGPLAAMFAAARNRAAAPLAELGVAAGTGRELFDEPCDAWVALPDGLPPRRYVALRVVGDSMTPLLHSGDVVLVDLDAAVPAGCHRGGAPPGPRLGGQAGAPGGRRRAPAGLAQPGLPAARAPARRGGPARAGRGPVVRPSRTAIGGETETCPSSVVRASSRARAPRPSRPARAPGAYLIRSRHGTFRRFPPAAGGPCPHPRLGLLRRPDPRRRAPAPAAGHATAGTAVRAMTVPALEGFETAVGRGTRTRTGVPGPRYWQQWADYKLSAELNPVSKRMTGSGTITYSNRSPDTLHTVYVQLLQNIFAPNARHNTGVPWSVEGIEFGKVAAQGTTLAAAGGEGPGYEVNGTIMRLRLPKPLVPGGTADLAFDWKLRVPPDGAPRGGQDGEVYYMNYWYPQMAVYDDVNGWQIDQYLGNAEFYMGYGNYDVSLTLPAGWLVTATGTLQNPDEVLDRSRPARGWTRRGAPTGIVHVVTDVDREPGRSTTAGKDGKLTWHFRAAERARRELGRLVALPVGRHQRRRGRREQRRPAGHHADPVVLAPGAAGQPLGRERALQPVLDRVLLEVPLALSVPAHDRGGRPQLVRRHGVPDDDLHRRAVGHARACTR